jgi:hypothetical protein
MRSKTILRERTHVGYRVRVTPRNAIADLNRRALILFPIAFFFSRRILVQMRRPVFQHHLHVVANAIKLAGMS